MEMGQRSETTSDYTVRPIAVFLCWLVMTALVLAPTNRCPAQEDAVTGLEYQVKAGFVYNFAKFIRWPEAAFERDDQPLVLCIGSKDPVCDIFFSLDEKPVRGRRIKVKRWSPEDNQSKCHILFLGAMDVGAVHQALASLHEKYLLTVGESEGFLQSGGIINFISKGNRLRFEVNLDAAEAAGLKLSAQILMSAEIVRIQRE